MQNLLVRKPAILLVFLTLLEAPSSLAQVIPDGTVNSRVNPQGNTSQIEGGATRGNNLFHSFKDFSVPKGNTAYFNNAVSIQNIISRVTGNSTSSIDGVLKANGTANLFLLNPKGISFGENARLDVGGSFLGTTADNIKFVDGTQFSATTPQDSQLLTMSVPIGLDFRGISGEIRVSGTGHQLPAGVSTTRQPTSREDNPEGLEVLPGKTLALVGGDVLLNNSAIYAPGGRIEVGSVKRGQVTFDSTNPQWSFNYNTQSNFGEILLTNSSLLDTSGPGGASLEMYGRQILFEDDSVILMQNQGTIPDKEIKLQATELIRINNNAPLFGLPAGIHTGATDLGSGAYVTVISPSIILQGGSIIDTKTYTSAKAGNISIEAQDYLKIEGTSNARPQVVSGINAITFASGKAGDVSINTSNLLLNEGGRLSSVTFGQGSGGMVFVKADLVEILGFEPKSQQGSQIQAASLGPGNAGDLTIDTSKLIISKGGLAGTTTLDSGDGGNLTINANDFIEVNGMDSDTTPETTITAEAIQISPILRSNFNLPPIPSGNSGSITINTPRLTVTGKGRVSVLNEGTGNAGELKIFANTITLEDNSSLAAATFGGEGGNIILTADLILLRDGNVNASASKQGQGGNVNISSDVFVALRNSDISANAQNAKGGNITFDTTDFLISPDTTISATSELGTQFSGAVTFSNPDTDLDLATTTVETEISKPEISAICRPSSNSVSKFIVSGEGGLPTGANDSLTSTLGWHDSSGGVQQSITTVNQPSETIDVDDAQGWVKNPDGTMSLVAVANVPITQTEKQRNCNAQKTVPPSPDRPNTHPNTASNRTNTPLTARSESTKAKAPDSIPTR